MQAVEDRLKQLAANKTEVKVDLGGGMTLRGRVVEIDGLGRIVVETKTGHRFTASKVTPV